MECIVVEDARKLADTAADFLLAEFQKFPQWNLCCATGGSPMRTYQTLAKQTVSHKMDLSRLHCFHLDEYAGLSPRDPRSCHFYIVEHVIKPLRLKPSQATLWQGDTPSREETCAQYENAIRQKGGIHCQIVGLGINGHIGFNEPGSERTSRCREVALTDETLRHNAKDLAGENIPTHALTMGIADILEARTLLLLVTGTNKRESLKRLMELSPTPDYPATFLKEHPNVTLITDRPAVGSLRL
ncbi:MAG: hypothetical protein A3H42_00315 [Deltaproteobacteria bacterium RIFCSPLOWO2_02_FULL_46_8]|nr:MAG: hypothetical protein A3H42_00315 [Deltaproteobacteria bacterium RIFCSPLOWO2_02_FULL_46_8]